MRKHLESGISVARGEAPKKELSKYLSSSVSGVCKFNNLPYFMRIAGLQGFDIIGRPEERTKVMPLQHARRG